MKKNHFPKRDGFALLITITLVAFLVLVLVSLATLTRVETRVASNSQHLAQARQNALLGLNLALGQLQTFAGPDQRATAPANLGDGGAATAENLLVPTRNGSRHWTGVWGNRNAWGSTTTAPGLLNWLVSGNEDVLVASEQNTSAPELFGMITSPVPEPGFVPNGALPSLNDATTVSDNLGDWQLLVGPNTAGPVATRFVVAPTRPIRVPAATLPGFAANDADQTIGHYAWWVGDEGVKASVSLVDPIATRTTAAERSYSFITAQRVGIERVVADYPANAPALNNVLSLPQLPLAAAGDPTALNAATEDHFHNFTAGSASVLADVSRGGLKKDLTAWIDHGGGPSDTDPIIPGTGSLLAMPQWGIVRSYADTTDNGTPKAPVAGSASQQGINPVITSLSLGYGISRDPAGGFLRIHLFPAVVLWNPLNVTIEGEYEVCIAYRNPNPRIRFTVLDSTGAEVTPAKSHVFIPHYGGGTGGSRFFRFRTEVTAIPPGRSLMFALQTPDQAYSAGNNLLAAVSPAHASSPGNVTNSAVITSTLALDADEQVRWDELGSPSDSSNYGWHSANLDVLLRAPAANDISAPYTTLAGGDYHAVQYVGYHTSTPVNVPATATPPPVSFQPVLQNNVRMEMAGTPYRHMLRWLAHTNPRARQSFRTTLDGGFDPLFTVEMDSGSPSPVNTNDGVASSGLRVNYTGSPTVDVVVAEFRPEGVPLFSLAQLQHANLSLISAHPAYPVGNAITNPYLTRTQTTVETNFRNAQEVTLHDLSWHLNRVLWDRHYFSTVPASLTQADIDSGDYRLPNARIGFFNGDDPPDAADFLAPAAFSTNAARLIVKGGFNVNSTSVPAWRALLAGLNGVAYDPQAPADTSASIPYPFTRYAAPRGGENGAWSPNDTWAGYRSLSGAAIDSLAQNIVAEVKKRGPFLSLADFINRRLVEDDGGGGEGTGFKGAIQAAIDAHDDGVANNHPDAINRRGALASTPGPVLAPAHPGVHTMEFWAGTTRSQPQASFAAFAPGFLTQADVLTALGPVLTARSDTFRIRAYGDARNPVTGEPLGRAWCEAVVQRTPDYVNPSANDPEDWPVSNANNQDFGRRFKIVSFRWLTAKDI